MLINVPVAVALGVVAVLATILIPAMRARGYSGECAAAICSSSARLAIIIPPSIPMILYAVIAEQSVVKMFVAGILPGLVGAFGLALAAYVIARRRDFPDEQAFSLPASGGRPRKRPGPPCCRSSSWAAFSEASSPRRRERASRLPQLCSSALSSIASWTCASSRRPVSTTACRRRS